MTRIRKIFSKNINLKISFDMNNLEVIQELYNISEKFPGSCGLILHIVNSVGKLEKIKSSNILISSDQLCLEAFREKLGVQNVWIS